MTSVLPAIAVPQWACKTRSANELLDRELIILVHTLFNDRIVVMSRVCASPDAHRQTGTPTAAGLPISKAHRRRAGSWGIAVRLAAHGRLLLLRCERLCELRLQSYVRDIGNCVRVTETDLESSKINGLLADV